MISLKRKSIFFLLAAAVLLVLGACSDKEKSVSEKVELDNEKLENVNESGMPIVKEPVKLDFFAGKAPATNDNWNDVMVFNEYEKMTDMDINWTMVPHESLAEKRNLTLASGNLPDAFHSAGMPSADILKYGQQGVFLPLNDLIDKYAPNFKKILEENPEVKKALTFPDGNIYSFPLMSDPDFLSYRLGPKPRINIDWLEALDMDMPETTEDFYEYLKAVKEKDPNGNGKADEIPYGAPGIDTLLDFLLGSYGLANMGTSNGTIDLDPDTNELRFYPTTDGYKEMLQYVNKLYSEELIEQNIFTIESNQYHANGMEEKYGSTVWYNPVDIFGDEPGKPLVGLPALEGPKGNKGFNTIMPTVVVPGAFLITNANEHPVATIKWIDYFYGDEGIKLFFMGIEGKTYEVNEDGETEYMDHILNSEEGLTYEQEQAKYLTFPGGGFPSVVSQKYFGGPANNPEDLEAAAKLKPDVVENPWSPFKYTKEENDKLAGFGHDIDKYVTEMRDKFISGDLSFDEWDKYVETIEGMNLEEYMKIKTEAYERYEDS